MKKAQIQLFGSASSGETRVTILIANPRSYRPVSTNDGLCPLLLAGRRRDKKGREGGR